MGTLTKSRKENVSALRAPNFLHVNIFATNMVGQLSSRLLVRRRNEGPETMEFSSKVACGELFGSRV